MPLNKETKPNQPRGAEKRRMPNIARQATG